MGIPNWVHQGASNWVAAKVQYVTLYTGVGGGTTGANEGVGVTRQPAGTPTTDGIGDNNWSQVSVPCTSGTYTEGGCLTTLTGTALSVPTGVTATGSSTGGTLSAGTYYYVATAVNDAGETTVSSEVSAVLTGSTSSVALACSAVTGATKYNWYRGTTSGGENKLIATVTGLSYTDTGGAGTTATLPVSNTASTFVFSAAFTGGPITVTGSSPVVNLVPGFTA